jgi:hypothetical protein
MRVWSVDHITVLFECLMPVSGSFRQLYNMTYTCSDIRKQYNLENTCTDIGQQYNLEYTCTDIGLMYDLGFKFTDIVIGPISNDVI